MYKPWVVAPPLSTSSFLACFDRSHAKLTLTTHVGVATVWIVFLICVIGEFSIGACSIGAISKGCYVGTSGDVAGRIPTKGRLRTFAIVWGWLFFCIRIDDDHGWDTELPSGWYKQWCLLCRRDNADCLWWHVIGISQHSFAPNRRSVETSNGR